MRRALIVAVFAGVPIISGGTALAQPDGLIDVAVGTVTIANDVRVNDGARYAAVICGEPEGKMRGLARTVDNTNQDRTVCTLPKGQQVRILDNV